MCVTLRVAWRKRKLQQDPYARAEEKQLRHSATTVLQNITGVRVNYYVCVHGAHYIAIQRGVQRCVIAGEIRSLTNLRPRIVPMTVCITYVHDIVYRRSYI